MKDDFAIKWELSANSKSVSLLSGDNSCVMLYVLKLNFDFNILDS